MLYGTVVQYFPARGFGFIRADFGPDVYFHVSSIGGCQGEPQIAPGQFVKYELVPGTEAKSRGRRAGDREDGPSRREPDRPRAQLVELIDRLPGAVLDDVDPTLPAKHHPRARRKKPNWRR